MIVNNSDDLLPLGAGGGNGKQAGGGAPKDDDVFAARVAETAVTTLPASCKLRLPAASAPCAPPLTALPRGRGPHS